MSPWKIWEESPFSGPLGREKILNLKWRGHGRDGRKWELGDSDPPLLTLCDILGKWGSMDLCFESLWLYLWCLTVELPWDSEERTEVRMFADCRVLVNAANHARLTSSTAMCLWPNSIREQRNKESWAHGETDSQVQVYSEQQLCGSQGGWRRWLHNIPLEIFYQLVLSRSQISPLCWVHCIVLPPRNLIACSVSGFFGMEGCCMVYQILHWILDLGKNTTCPNAIIALLSICLLNGIMLSRSVLSILFCKNAFQTFLSDLF